MGNRDDFVKSLLGKSPEMPVHYMNNSTKEIWATEKILKELGKEDRNKFNLRKQLPNEIILDIEEKYRLQEIKEELNNREWVYEIWDTGSRGLHISIKFENLHQQPVELRNRIRKHIINIFKTDEKLSKEKQWLALEWTPHFKTGREKVLLEVVKSDKQNYISEDIILFCKQAIETEKKNVLTSDEDFKDYYKNDPYLKYVLKNVVSNGERDYVLFKNLAIGLVRSGLEIVEIEKLAKAIVKNCPGKSVSEFMGWVYKVRDGELMDYNRDELVQWAIRHNHPILYKLVEDAIDLLSIKQLWDAIWAYNIACQPIWRDLCFYNLLGTVIDERKDDYRIHVIMQSYTSTGKDEGINLVEDVLKRLGYKTSRPGDITDKTLVGSVNPTAIEENTKHGVSENDPMKGKWEYKDEIEYGLLGTVDWMAFSEAENVFKPGPHNRRLQSHLREAMDKRRQIEKGVGGRRIILNTNTSLMMATYSMDNIIYNILHNGIFQRAVFYNKELSEDEHIKISQHISMKLFDEDVKLNFNQGEYMSLLVEKLKTMKHWYDENKSKISYFEGAAKEVDKLWERYRKKYASLPKIDKMNIDGIARRGRINLNKLIILNSTWNMRTAITKEDVNNCFKLLEECMESVKKLVLKQDVFKKKQYGILHLLKDGSMSNGNLRREMSEQLNIKSPNGQGAEIEKVKSLGLVMEYPDGKFKMLGLTEKGRRLFFAEE